MLILSALMFIACSDSNTYYTVTFIYEGNVIQIQQVEEGKTATKPQTPAEDMKEFSTWYTKENECPDSEYNQVYTFYNDGESIYYFDFSTKITKDLTIYFVKMTFDSTTEVIDEDDNLQP